MTQVASLGEELTQLNIQLRVEVIQGQAGEVRLALPEGLIINQVSGAAVADWQTKAGVLVISFLEPVQRETRLVIAGERPSARDGQIGIPVVRLEGVERETGGIGVEVLGAGEIGTRDAVGLQEVAAADLGEPVSSRDSPSLVAFRFRPFEPRTARSLTVKVSRYTPQALLTANVEEARFDVLLSPEGKALIHARYAVRNNQRNFLKATLPSGAAFWSASLRGKPIRPGRSPDGALLLPLAKGRAGEQTELFPVELLYLDRSGAWSEEKGQASVKLPALDLPVSRTGLQVYHSPAYRLAPRPGAFRLEPFAPASSEAFDRVGETDTPSARAPASAPALPNQMAIQALADKFQGGARSGRGGTLLPVNTPFPALGPSLFFLSELTTENQTPVLELEYEKTKKRGGL
ncbi:MAG: hypothetical protein EHM61_25705 [Acidobacteria bacterium]|nr:MAG: hypothetical protein EHM61_25705 [Acidobacteriota bacterium]